MVCNEAQPRSHDEAVQEINPIKLGRPEAAHKSTTEPGLIVEGVVKVNV
jgi:hypothetical protein